MTFNRSTVPQSRMGRLQFVADALGVPMPEGVPPNLLDRDGTPARKVLDFCIQHGASLDFIYLADVAILVGYTAQAMREREVA